MGTYTHTYIHAHTSVKFFQKKSPISSPPDTCEMNVMIVNPLPKRRDDEYLRYSFAVSSCKTIICDRKMGNESREIFKNVVRFQTKSVRKGAADDLQNLADDVRGAGNFAFVIRRNAN